MIDLLTLDSDDVTVTDAQGTVHDLPSYPHLVATAGTLTDNLTGAVAQVQAINSQVIQYKSDAAASASSASTSADNAGSSESAAAASETNAGTSASTASQAASDAASAKSQAASSASSAATAAGDADSSASAANLSASDASDAASDAATSVTLANAWADAAVSIEVAPGEYSAYHWAMKAQSTVTGLLTYRGSWEASTSSYPAAPVKGDFWKVSTDGSVSGTAYSIGDQIIYNGGGWDKIDNTESVTSVSGRVGAITLSASDITGLGSAATADSSAFATASQGTKADAAMPKTGGTFSGAIGSSSIDVGTEHLTSDSGVSVSGNLRVRGTAYQEVFTDPERSVLLHVVIDEEGIRRDHGSVVGVNLNGHAGAMVRSGPPGSQAGSDLVFVLQQAHMVPAVSHQVHKCFSWNRVPPGVVGMVVGRVVMNPPGL